MAGSVSGGGGRELKVTNPIKTAPTLSCGVWPAWPGGCKQDRSETDWDTLI